VKRKAAPAAALPTQFTGPGESPGFLLWKVSNAWQRRQRVALQPFGLTHSQFVLLAVATWFGTTEHLTQARLSELSGVDPMTTSQIVRALEANALLARDDHPGDTRAKSIAVTAAGRAKAREALVAVEKADMEFFAVLEGNEARLVSILKTLARADER
jgi:MarR family transcriptional regulator, organic hydroperoxide resistance regulator